MITVMCQTVTFPNLLFPATTELSTLHPLAFGVISRVYGTELMSIITIQEKSVGRKLTKNITLLWKNLQEIEIYPV